MSEVDTAFVGCGWSVPGERGQPISEGGYSGRSVQVLLTPE